MTALELQSVCVELSGPPPASTWLGAHRMRAGAPQRQDEETRRRERVAERKILFMQKAAHVVPVGLIQCADFASDVMVIVQLATAAGGAAADWIACVAAVGFSVLVAWFGMFTDEALSAREKLIGCALACANLHVLYVGTRFISAVYEGRSQEDVGSLYGTFVLLKMLETGIESIVLSVVTAGAFFRALGDGGSGLALFASSLALSLLSMAYALQHYNVCYIVCYTHLCV